MAETIYLSELESAALLLGIADARQRRRIVSGDRNTLLRSITLAIFGQSAALPLANPTLEGLRALAMACAQGQGFWSGHDNSWDDLDRTLLLRAREFLADQGFLEMRPDRTAVILQSVTGPADLHYEAAKTIVVASDRTDHAEAA